MLVLVRHISHNSCANDPFVQGLRQTWLWRARLGHWADSDILYHFPVSFAIFPRYLLS
jgi:hypothetical protein